MGSYCELDSNPSVGRLDRSLEAMLDSGVRFFCRDFFLVFETVTSRSKNWLVDCQFVHGEET